jgi:hypothetical protein
MAQGTTQTLTVKPCPAEGEYIYKWFMDTNPIPSASTTSFDYMPGPGDTGMHLIAVEAIGWGDGSEYTQVWDIEIH